MRAWTIIVWVVALHAARADAQPAVETSARRAVLLDAERARAAGDWWRALELAQRAAQERETPSVQLLIAQAQRALDHPVDAWDYAARCARAAEADPALPDRERVLRGCVALEALMRARVGMLTIATSSPAPAGWRLRVRGVEVDPAAWATGRAVAPGDTAVDAEADGLAPFHATVSIAAGAQRAVEVAWSPRVEPTPAPVVTAPSHVTTSCPPPREASVRAGPWIVLGSGLAVLGGAALLFALREEALADSNAATVRGDNAASDARYDDAGTFNALTSAALILGAAASVAGVAWLVVDMVRGPHRTATVQPTAWLRGDGAVFGVGGAL